MSRVDKISTTTVLKRDATHFHFLPTLTTGFKYAVEWAKRESETVESEGEQGRAISPPAPTPTAENLY